MKKIFLISILFLLASLFFVPRFVMAWAIGDPIVPQTCSIGNTTFDNTGVCTSGSPTCPCGITDFFTLLNNIYQFIILGIATPLAIIAITIGGIILLLSAGNPNLAGLGKKILYAAIIGLALVFCSWVIINSILTILGYTGTWSTLGT